MQMTATLQRTAVNETARPQLNLLLVVVSLLLTIGLLMMTSASVEIASSQHGDPFFHCKRQLVFAAIGMLVMLLSVHIAMNFWCRLAPWLLLIALALLALVLMPGVGKTVNGSMRWIDLGAFDLQVSELAKVLVVIYLAACLSRQPVEVRQRWSGFVKPMLVIGTAVVLLHFEPDHGAMVILLFTALCLLFLAGAGFYRVLLLLLLGGGAVIWVAVMKPYVIARFSSYLNPWSAENVYAGGYQLTQALIAFGRGAWSGTGLGNSVQKLYFLPEAHNDFVLAIIGEELGLIGVATVILLFCMLVLKGFLIARAAQARDMMFSSFVAYGLSLLFAGQALINIGVNIGLLPTKGLTLPFLSYGGASLIMSCFMVALLLRIQYEAECCHSRSDRRVARWQPGT